MKALSVPIFRNYIFGAFFSEAGNQMQTVAVAWQVYEITRNPASLALIGLAHIIPIFGLSLIGGVAADKIDRKKILIIAQSSMALLAFSLFFLTHNNLITPYYIYGVLILSGVAQAFSMPARQAILPNLVPSKFFMNAISLHTLQFQTATMMGPAIAGLLIAGYGVESVYLFNGLSFLIFIISILGIKKSLNVEHSDVEFNIKSIMDGIKFVVKTPILYSTMILDFLATFFGTANILMPVFAKEVLHVGPQGLGLLYSAPAFGGVMAGILLSTIPKIKSQGPIIIGSVILYGAAIIGFGLSKVFGISIAFLILMGFGDMVSTIIRNTIRQLVTPDYLRGRMVSIMRMFFQGGPQLGEIEAGLLAKAIGAPATVVIGGVGVILITAVMAVKNRSLRKFTLDKS